MPQFACVCAQKSVEFGPDKKLHRALKDQQLHDGIQALLTSASTASDAAATTATVCAFQPGGGVRIDGAHPDLSLASLDTCVAVFHGQLQNAGELMRKVGGCGGAAACVGAGSLAELMCRLYVAHGVELLSMLRGTFSFCLYESKTARVLASSDTSGGIPLFEGRTASGDLIVASSQDYLTNCTDIVPFQPGDYKYGWHAMHRQYDPADFASDGHGRKMASESRKSHEHPHHGLGNGSTARRRSEEHAQGRPTSAGYSSRRSHDVSSPYQSAEKAHRPPSGNFNGGLTASRLANCSNGTSNGSSVNHDSSSQRRRPARSPSSSSSCHSHSSSGAPSAGKSHGSLDPDACPFTPTRTATAHAPASPSPSPQIPPKAIWVAKSSAGRQQQHQASSLVSTESVQRLVAV